MNVITFAIFDNDGGRLAVVQREGLVTLVNVRAGLLDASTFDRQARREAGADRERWVLGALLAGAGGGPVLEVTK